VTGTAPPQIRVGVIQFSSVPFSFRLLSRQCTIGHTASDLYAQGLFLSVASRFFHSSSAVHLAKWLSAWLGRNSNPSIRSASASPCKGAVLADPNTTAVGSSPEQNSSCLLGISGNQPNRRRKFAADVCRYYAAESILARWATMERHPPMAAKVS